GAESQDGVRDRRHPGGRRRGQRGEGRFALTSAPPRLPLEKRRDRNLYSAGRGQNPALAEERVARGHVESRSGELPVEERSGPRPIRAEAPSGGAPAGEETGPAAQARRRSDLIIGTSSSIQKVLCNRRRRIRRRPLTGSSFDRDRSFDR